MVSLYRDPHGKNVIVRPQRDDTFEPKTSNIPKDTAQVELLQNKIKDLERKLTTMTTCSCNQVSVIYLTLLTCTLNLVPPTSALS